MTANETNNSQGNLKQPLISLVSVSKSYLSGNGNRMVLSNVSIEVPPGETLAIVGPSGSGKTTLLNIIATLDKPDSGSVFFESTDLIKFNTQQLAHFRNQKIGMIFQLHHLLPQCTLWENVLIPSLPAQKNQQEAEKQAETLLKRTGIWGYRHQKPTELSGGECQRAAVVRALVNKPSLILADEPTGALDHSNALNLIDLLLELNQEMGTALVVVTHSLEIARKMNKIYELDNGILENKTL